MLDKRVLCEKITSIYPEIGACGIDIDVNFNKEKGAWVVDLNKGTHHLQTHLEIDEAEQCLVGKKCVSLGVQIAQLTENIKQL